MYRWRSCTLESLSQINRLFLPQDSSLTSCVQWAHFHFLNDFPYYLSTFMPLSFITQSYTLTHTLQTDNKCTQWVRKGSLSVIQALCSCSSRFLPVLLSSLQQGWPGGVNQRTPGHPLVSQPLHSPQWARLEMNSPWNKGKKGGKGRGVGWWWRQGGNEQNSHLGGQGE